MQRCTNSGAADRRAADRPDRLQLIDVQLIDVQLIDVQLIQAKKTRRAAGLVGRSGRSYSINATAAPSATPKTSAIVQSIAALIRSRRFILRARCRRLCDGGSMIPRGAILTSALIARRRIVARRRLFSSAPPPTAAGPVRYRRSIRRAQRC